MPDYLAREDAPLSAEDWGEIDKAVVESARKRLIGRRFINISGPLGPGAQVVQNPKLSDISEDRIEVKERMNLTIPLIYKDFKLSWRDIESARQYGMPLELGPVIASADFCALEEDKLIFNGCDECGYEGLTNAKGCATVDAQDWKGTGNAFQNVVNAIERLTSAGFYSPYAMVVSPPLYAMMHRILDGRGVLEIEMIRKLIEGVFQTPVIKGDGVIVLATGAQNLDLVIAQDLITAYLGPEGMDHLFRVFETVALRIKRPGSICAFS